MTRLKLSQRDDPLGLAREPHAGAARKGVGAVAAAAAEPERPAEAEPAAQAEAAKPSSRRTTEAPAPAPEPPGAVSAGGGPYDEDRLEQTGWRVYESVKAGVREHAEALSAAGTPTSEAKYVAAVLALRAPATLDERVELMGEWNRLTASRRRRSA